MSLWIILPLIVYFLGVVMFLVAIYTEAPKHSAEIGVLHYVVAFIWPMWGIWYVWLVASDWFNKWRTK